MVEYEENLNLSMIEKNPATIANTKNDDIKSHYTIEAGIRARYTCAALDLFKERCDFVKLDGIIKKLQRAIISKGLIVKIKNDQFWSEEQKRLITVKQVCVLVSYRNRNDEWKQKDYEILKTCSLLEVCECLKDIWEAVR